MSDKNSHQNDPSKASRADDLLLDYFDEMFSLDAGAPKQTDPIAEKESALSTQPSRDVNGKEALDGVPQANSISAESSGVVRSKEGAAVAEPAVTSHSRHPNLKPASAILANKQSMPFKEEKVSVNVVVAGLMPKLQPVSKQQSKEPEVEQSVNLMEEVNVSTVIVEPVVAPEIPVDVQTAAIDTLEPETREDTEQPETVEKSATHESLKERPEQTQEVIEREKQELDATVAATAVESEYKDAELSEVSTALDEEPPATVPPRKVAAFRELAEFEMLLFDVRGLQLAVPLISLGSIHRLEDDFTPIVGRADWYLGMYRIGDRNLQVVDTARWVMPSRMQAVSDEPYEFVIRLADTHWALACSGVHQAIRVERDQIKWRTQQGKRPWLAGTVISKMCALLDVESMADLLDDDKLQDTP